MKKSNRPINIVSIALSPEARSRFNAITDQRGMTIKSLLGRLIAWFSELDRTEQSIVLNQVERADATKLADLINRRK